MMVCNQGSTMIEPTPTPENARLKARPRRRTNQLGRKSACAVYPRQLPPAPTSMPSVA